MRPRDSRRAALIAMVPAAVVALAAGCHHRRPASAMGGTCAPLTTPLPSDVNPADLVGTYRITFFLTQGGEAGEPVGGRLVLFAQDSARVRVGPPDAAPGADVTQPVIGQLDLARQRLGAADTGDPMSADPAQPGVAAYVTRRPDGGVTSVTLRIGAQSNVRGAVVFDAAYFALYVKRVVPDGFAGGWASGLGLRRVEGYFCAERLRG